MQNDKLHHRIRVLEGSHDHNRISGRYVDLRIFLSSCCPLVAFAIYLSISIVGILEAANIMSHNLSHGKPSVNRQVFLLGAVLTFGYLASCIHTSSRVYLFQQAQCLTYYKTYDPTKIDSRYGVAEALCKLDEIQSPLSIIQGIDSFLQFLPGTVYSSSSPPLSLPQEATARAIIANLTAKSSCADLCPVERLQHFSFLLP